MDTDLSHLSCPGHIKKYLLVNLIVQMHIEDDDCLSCWFYMWAVPYLWSDHKVSTEIKRFTLRKFIEKLESKINICVYMKYAFLFRYKYLSS